MTRYLRLLGIFWRTALSTELEYRVNFLSNAVMSLFWVVWAGIGISVYFRFTDSVAGWTYPELIVVVGLFFAVNGVRQAVFDPNLERMSDYVRNGTLDFLLTKPVDAQFMASFRHVGVANLLDPFIGLGLTVVGLALAGDVPGPAELGAFAVTFGAAVLILYALTLAAMSLAIRLVSSEGIGEVTFAFVEAARFPVQVYRQPVRTLLTIVPVAFLTTLPAEALLGRLAPGWLLVAPVVAVGTVFVAGLAWRAALRGYSGASA
jgi:ABC-2 type transport system permease protein